MVGNTYLQAQRLIEQLSPVEQIRLLEYLSLRISRVVSSLPSEQSTMKSNHTRAWKEFFRIGDELIHTDNPNSQTLTATVLAMRR